MRSSPGASARRANCEIWRNACRGQTAAMRAVARGRKIL